MTPTTPSRRAGLSLNDLARQLAPHLQIISASQPVPLLREHNVLGIADDPEVGRKAVLLLEGIEHADDQLGTVVMGPGAGSAGNGEDDGKGHVDPEGVGRQVLPRVVAGGLLGALVGAVIIGSAALLFGAEGWELIGAAAAGGMLFAVFGAMWLTFAGFGGSDAYRQTFVSQTSALTIVSVHTDDPEESASAQDRLADDPQLRVLKVDRRGHVIEGSPPSSNTQ